MGSYEPRVPPADELSMQQRDSVEPAAFNGDMARGVISGPQINQDHFVAKQRNTVVAILPSDRFEDCVAALAAAGADVSRVNVLRGRAGLRVLDFDGTEHGAWAHIVRTLQKLGSASNERENFANALRDGKIVLIVPVSDLVEVDRFARVLYERGGHRLIHFSAHSAEPLSY